MTGAGASRAVAVHGAVLAALLAVLLLWAGGMVLAVRAAALPDERAGTMIALFPPDLAAAEMAAAIARADGLMVRNGWFGNVWIVHSDRPGFAARLRAEGAWAAFDPAALRPVAIGGCFGLRVAAPARPI